MRSYLKTYRSTTTGILRSRMIAGLLYLLPFAITVGVFVWVYNVLANSIQPMLSGQPGYVVPLVILAMLVGLPVLLGFAMMLPVARRAMNTLGQFAKRVPIAGSIFRVGEGIAIAVNPETPRGLNQVVRVEYPRKGMWSLGFLTAQVEMDDGEEWGVVFLPTAPLPNSGWVALLPLGELHVVDISTSDAMAITLSAGMLVPEKLSSKPYTPDRAAPGDHVKPERAAVSVVADTKVDSTDGPARVAGL